MRLLFERIDPRPATFRDAAILHLMGHVTWRDGEQTEIVASVTGYPVMELADGWAL